MTLGDGHVVGPGGDARTWTDLLWQFPFNSVNRGALIGRAGNANGTEAFLIGEQSTVTAPTSGHLFLCANHSPDLSEDGSYTVHIKPQAAKETAKNAPGPSIDLVTME